MSFIHQHIYLFLFVLTITEWPITSFVSAWFAAQGILRIEYIIGLAILWDLIGDVIFYVIGRFFHKIRFIKRFHQYMTQRNILKTIYTRSPFFYFLIVKITPYLAMPSLISLGIKKTNFRVYMKYSLIMSIIVKAIYITAGYLWSFSVGQASRFLDGWKTIVVYGLVGIALLRGIKKLYRRLSQYIRRKIKEEIKTEQQ